MAVASTIDLLQEGLSLHRRGAVDEAAARYGEVLRLDPANPDAHYYLGMLACQQQRFAAGAEHAQQALASDPRHVRAHVLLGRASSALGRSDEALTCFDRAIALAPDLAPAHSHRADILNDLGRTDEAIASYDRALALAPDGIEDWFNRGMALHALERHHEAISSFDRVIAGRPNFAPAYLGRAKALSDLLRHDEALTDIDRALAIDPSLAEAWLGRGHFLRGQHRHEDALAAYDKASALKPDLAEAWLGRGSVLLATGQLGLAIGAARRALALNEAPHTKAFFAQCATFAGAGTDDGGEWRELVFRALSEAWIRPRELSGLCIALIKRSSIVRDCIARASEAWPERLTAAELCGPSGLAVLADDPLLACLLECSPVADVGLERLLTNVRHILLASGAADDEPGEDLLRFYCAVARQCFINGYVFSTTEAETEKAKQLQTSLEAALTSGDPCPAIWPVIVGAYGPLNTVSNAEALLDRSLAGGWPPCVQALIVQQVAEPLEERRIAAGIPMLTAIDDAVSRAVRQQYEESPYPRWVMAGPPARPGILEERKPEQIRDVLIAGCGTGLITVEFARQAARARFLAIDLSRASISYAERMAQKLGVKNVKFAQADIMGLASLGQDFDFIEASGVLHHLADPWAGWRILLSLLRPGGMMQVGLYSELARRHVVEARALIAQHGYRPIPQDIRRCREEIMAAGDGTVLKSLTGVADFFTTNDCRDLLFHVQEHRTTLPDIKSFLAANDVEFAGFVLDAATRQRFVARFAEPGALLDLDCWHVFETELPNTFANMYQFGVQKRATYSGSPNP
jgi:tetratricopeptide (TPR) repeat protein/SAM-dependent methyltransferase